VRAQLQPHASQAVLQLSANSAVFSGITNATITRARSRSGLPLSHGNECARSEVSHSKRKEASSHGSVQEGFQAARPSIGIAGSMEANPALNADAMLMFQTVTTLQLK